MVSDRLLVSDITRHLGLSLLSGLYFCFDDFRVRISQLRKSFTNPVPDQNILNFFPLPFSIPPSFPSHSPFLSCLSLSPLHLLPLHSLTLHTSAQLQIYQARISTNPSRTEIWKVEGVATVEIGGLHPAGYVFDCNTTLNNGSGVRWSRLDGSHLNGLVVRPLINGERLDAERISYMHLGNYSCWDERTNDQLILRITDSKNTDIVLIDSLPT